MEMQPILPPNRPSASLSVEQWNIVLMTLDERPHRLVRSLIDALMEQLSPQSQASPLSTEDAADKLRPADGTMPIADDGTAPPARSIEGDRP